MSDLISEGAEFSCNYCSSKLSLTVTSSSTKGDAKKLAHEGNSMFKPPGGMCSYPPGNAPKPCPGIPMGCVTSTGQSTVKIDSQTALGQGCSFKCPMMQSVSLSSAGQTVAKHDTAEKSIGDYVLGGALVVGGVVLAIALLPEEAVAAVAVGAGIAVRVAGRAAIKGAKKLGSKTKNLFSKKKPEINQSKPSPSEAANRTKHENYKTELRQKMEKPHAEDPQLKKIIDKNYRENADVGSGSTAEAIRYEKATGNAVKGKYHSQKGEDTITSLERWLEKDNKLKDKLANEYTKPSSGLKPASPGDRAAAENVIRDLKDALGH